MKDTINDWVSEHCSTEGTGNLILIGAEDSAQARWREGVNSGSVYYSIKDGLNREAGVGTFNGTNTITRATVHATLVSGVFTDVAPSAISLTGNAVVSGTFNADAYVGFVTDIASLNSSVSSLTGRVAQNETDIADHETRLSQNETTIGDHETRITDSEADILTVAGDLVILDDDVSYREMSITALEQGGGLTQNGATVITIAAGGGEIIDSYTDPESQVTEEVTWTETNFDLLANAGMPVLTGVGTTHIGIITGGVVRAYPSGMSTAQRRTAIRVGIVEYVDQTITKVLTTPIVSNQIGNTLLDLIDYLDTEFKIKGLTLRPTEIGDLSLWQDTGTYFGVGANYENAINDQNILPLAASGAVNTAVPFYPIEYNNGVSRAGAEISTINADQFEPGGAGTLDTLGNGKTVIHYIFRSIPGTFFQSYGQQEYGTYAEAKTNLFADKSSHLLPAEFKGMILLGQVIIIKGATVWASDSAEVFPTGASTSSASGGASIGNAIDIAYTDTYSLGVNVQVAIDSLGAIKLSSDQHAAVNAAAVPTGANPFATIADVDAVTGVTDHTALTNIGVNTHVQIDNHLSDTANPHGVTATTVGLGNANNTADIDKPVSDDTQAALNGKADIDKNLRGALSGGILYITTDGSTPGP